LKHKVLEPKLEGYLNLPTVVCSRPAFQLLFHLPEDFSLVWGYIDYRGYNSRRGAEAVEIKTDITLMLIEPGLP
jgi:hypothetical protein